MTGLEATLRRLCRALAHLEPWIPAWMEAWINEAHLEAELARLKAGKPSCGCDLCRESRATTQATLRVTKVKGDTGRPPVALPLARLLELHQQGHGYRAITGVMAQEYGVEASHMTIQRRLSGRRKG